MSRPRVAIGPANYAGQAFAWSRALAQHLPVDAWSFQRGPVRSGSFRFASDVTIPAPLFHTSVARGIRSRRLFQSTTHIALDGFQPYFRLHRTHTFRPDARWLADRGFHVALIAHGTDVRDPQNHLRRDRWSYFREGTAAWRTELIEYTARNRDTVAQLGLPTFVSTPDLLLDLPGARWLPVCVDLDRWVTTEPVLERKRPRVLHVPSRMNPPIKGSQYIEPVLGNLHDDGLIEFVSPGRVPQERMPALVRDCDVVVDQILFGSWGVAAAEALAAGRVVIGRLTPEVRSLVAEAPPIVDADPQTLEGVLRGVLADREAYQVQAAAGVEFARRWHDGQASAAAMAHYLGVRSSATN